MNLASPGTVRLSVEEMERTRIEFEAGDAPKTYEKIMGLIEQGYPASTYRTRLEMTDQIKAAHAAKGEIIEKL